MSGTILHSLEYAVESLRYWEDQDRENVASHNMELLQQVINLGLRVKTLEQANATLQAQYEEKLSEYGLEVDRLEQVAAALDMKLVEEKANRDQCSAQRQEYYHQIQEVQTEKINLQRASRRNINRLKIYMKHNSELSTELDQVQESKAIQKTQLESALEKLTCFICRSADKEFVIPCGHAFCGKCLEAERQRCLRKDGRTLTHDIHNALNDNANDSSAIQTNISISSGLGSLGIFGCPICTIEDKGYFMLDKSQRLRLD